MSSSNLADLKSRLEAAKAAKITLTDDDREEIKLRDQIESEDRRLADEKARARKLECDRVLDKAKRAAEDPALCELLDLGEKIGIFVVTAPPGLVAEAFQDAIRVKGHAEAIDTHDLVVKSMLYPNPEESGVQLRETFDEYPFAAQSLTNVILRLGGLKIEMRAKK